MSANPEVETPVNLICCPTIILSVESTVIVLDAVVLATLPFGYPDPGSTILVRLTEPSASVNLPMVLAPVLIVAAALLAELVNVIQVGTFPGLPNASA